MLASKIRLNPPPQIWLRYCRQARIGAGVPGGGIDLGDGGDDAKAQRAVSHRNVCIGRGVAASTRSSRLRQNNPARPKALEDHLVGVAGGAGAVLSAAHGPGQQRPAQHMARHERRRGRQVLHPVGQELRAGGKRLREIAPWRRARRSTASLASRRIATRPRGSAGASVRNAAIRPGSNDIAATGACVAGQHLGGAGGEPGVAGETALELDHAASCGRRPGRTVRRASACGRRWP